MIVQLIERMLSSVSKCPHGHQSAMLEMNTSHLKYLDNLSTHNYHVSSIKVRLAEMIQERVSRDDARVNQHPISQTNCFPSRLLHKYTVNAHRFILQERGFSLVKCSESTIMIYNIFAVCNVNGSIIINISQFCDLGCSTSCGSWSSTTMSLYEFNFCFIMIVGGLYQ